MIDIFKIKYFSCGCAWDWEYHTFTQDCGKHGIRPIIESDLGTEKCTCLNPRKDDGATTCWMHHDCSDGSCTHYE